MTFGTRKYGGSGSGACFRTSSATAHGTTKSSRSVASAVWSSLNTCAIGSTLAVSSSFSFPMYSRISSICARYVSSSASLKSRYASSATRNTSSRLIFTLDSSLGRRRNFGRLAGIFLGDIVVDERLKCNGQLIIGAFERDVLLPININRAARRLAGSRQADADIRGLRLPRTVYDAAHHRQRHALDAFVLRLPDGHAIADVALNRLRQFLKRGAGGAPAAGARRHAGRKRTQPQRLEQFARGVNLFAPVAAWFGRQRDANRIANAFVEQHAQRSRRPDLPLHAHSSLGEAQVQWLFGLRGKIAVHGNEVARPRSLARNNDLVVPQPGFQRQLRRLQRRKHHAIVDDLLGFFAEILVRVLLHLAHDQLLIQRAAIHADPHGLAIVARDSADG